MDTKKRIIEQARKAFNQSGFGAVNLFELAKSLDISRGNMIYHFKDKEVLLEVIAGELWSKIEATKLSKTLPSFKNLHQDAQTYYKLQKEYSFIFYDNQVYTHPLVAPKMKVIVEDFIRNIEMAIAFSIQIGNMKKEPLPGLYKNLATSTWMLLFFGSTQKNFRGKKAKEEGEILIWSLLIPHLTEKGIASFKKFFGADYLAKLGEPFDHNLESYLIF